ncbi:MAG: MATE family efflux transporter [Acidaminococcus sp.]|jgi:putative MATE family efflux protein|nr:MATE family efflux transporter [Acidaminococcus sp.]MCI2099626.1 MATE family efflux transporter [Acidaminococcus sp.]MCI2113711.1 MATE family efflux transporter [Acidaminococcus sp.]MCI2115794.1 MATE family efflux transporter [Acidaminococcus sp.]
MAHTTTKDMTTGSIPRLLLEFALPLMVGNIFQMLYNTVDSIVVGNFVGTEALAAVSATTMVTNMSVFFFNGFSIGATVIIGKYFGARDCKTLHRAVETTMAATFILCLLFTVFFLTANDFMLEFMKTPADVFDEASLYLRIYFAGVTGLLIYNMGSGVLRAVGDTKRPLYFLMLTSVLNIILDLVFVLVFHMGIAGVAYATIIAQFISAAATMAVLIRTNDIYQFRFKDLCLDHFLLKEIFRVGLPTAIQSVITSFSNIFVQSYINFFGATIMAGWGCYNKIDQFVMLPVQSMAMASTTFVAQNVGARQDKRANDGTVSSIVLSLGIVFVIITTLVIFADTALRLFTGDEAVIVAGVDFIHVNLFFMLFNCVNQVLAGALRGRGDSVAPMLIMLFSFVLVRQIYLYIMSNYISNTPLTVGFGYPVGWMTCCVIEVSYFYLFWKHRPR